MVKGYKPQDFSFFHRSEKLVQQGIRSRLFSYWFEQYDNNLRYSIHTVCIKDEEGIDNFAALIIRNDNPNIADAVNEFMQTALALQSKPQNN